MTAARIVAATIAAGLGLGAAVLLLRTEVPADLRVPAVSAEEEFGAAAVREAKDFVAVLRALWLGSTLAQLGTLALLVLHGPQLAARTRGPLLVRALGVLAVVLLALWAVRLPFGVAAHWWRRRHGISEQPYLQWLVDPWPEWLATIAVTSAALAAAVLLAVRLGRRWWLAGGPALALVGAAVALGQPLVESPRLEPLDDPGLEREILELGERVGVEAVGVSVKDASRRTTRLNAQVIGAGETKRVVLWDTLLERASAEELRLVVAHELAHVARRHVPKGVAWFALLSLPLAFLLAESTRRRGGIAEPGAVPLAALVVVALQLALLPFANAVSRRYEAEADWLALSATADPDAARAVFHRFVRENLADPDPPRWVRVVLGTHPALVERAAMAEAFATRARSGEESPGGS
jgi:STE24 endopeptidase